MRSIDERKQYTQTGGEKHIVHWIIGHFYVLILLSSERKRAHENERNVVVEHK